MTNNYWQGDKVRLRAFEDEDLERYVEERKNPDSYRQLFGDSLLFPYSEGEMREHIKEYAVKFNKDDKRIFIVESLEGEYAGEISVWETERLTGVFKYGIFFEKQFQKKGFGKDSLKIVFDYYFNYLNYQKVNATVYSFNVNSQKFHENFGFTKEGIIRRDTYSQGKFHDMFHYGLLKEEFNELYKKNFG